MQSEKVGGRLRQFANSWREISNDPWVIDTVTNGLWLDFDSNPFQSFIRPEISMNEEQSSLCDQEIEALIGKGAIVASSLSPGDFVCNIFVIPKKIKGYRPVINLKDLNSFLEVHHFKMEGLHLLKSLVKQGDFFVKLDLKDAYFTVAINSAHSHFLKFHWKGNIYMFTCMPFGLSSAPWAFTKLLKVVMGILRRQGIRAIIFLDDFLFIDSSAEAVLRSVNIAIELLQRLGFIINWEKSVLIPSQVMEYLGLLIDSLNLSLSLPTDKVDLIIESCRALLLCPEVSVRDISSVLGRLSWATAALTYGQAHYRALQQQHIIGASSLPTKNSTLKLSLESRGEISWWIDNLANANGKSWTFNDPDLIIHSDASNTGWGGVCKGVRSGGPWSGADRHRHINELELLAAFNCVKAFSPFGSKLSILLYLDNATAVAYINKRGGTRSTRLNSLAMTFINWCESRNILCQAIHVPGVDNCIADAESRRRQDASDWKLSPHVFKMLLREFDMQVDLFAASWNAQLPRFVSWEPQPDAWRVDAMTFPWNSLNGFAFPPFSLIKDCALKIRNEGSELILITPFWTAQPWFPLVMELACAPALILPQQRDLLTSAAGRPHPMVESRSLLLVA